MALTGFTPNSQVLITFTGPLGAHLTPPGTTTPCSFYSILTTDETGTLETSVLSPRLTAGNYTGTVTEIVGATRTNKGDFSFKVADAPAGTPLVDTGSVSGTTFTKGATLVPGANMGITASGLPANQNLNAYVIEHDLRIGDGTVLVDVSDYVQDQTITFGGGVKGSVEAKRLSGTAEAARTSATGTLAATLWSNIHPSAQGKTFTVVLDMNTNGVYNAGTDIMVDKLSGSFTVSAAAARLAPFQSGNMSFDRQLTASDRFEPAEPVVAKFVPTNATMSVSNLGVAFVYVVAHKATRTAGEALTDVSGPNGTSSLNAVVTVNGEPVTDHVAIYRPDLKAGDYDIIIDANADGKYQPTGDFIDGTGAVPGFQVLSAAAPKEWTVMVYICGDNDLEQFGAFNINQMEAVNYGPPGGVKVNVAVQYDRHPGDYSGDGDWTNTRRYLIAHDTDINTIGTVPADDMPEQNMADPETLKSFVRWAKSVAPAQKYALLLWDHGAGFRSNRPVGRFNAIWDDTSGSASFTEAQVRSAVRDLGGVDLLAYDCCLMGSVETGYEMRGVCTQFVGSEDVVPGSGYDYTRFLNAMVASPTMSAEAAGKAMVTAFGQFYAASPNVTLATYASAKMDGVATALDDVARSMIDDPDGTGPQLSVINQPNVRRSVQLMLDSVQKFKGDPNVPGRFDDYKDAKDFCAQLKALNLKASVNTACTSALTAIDDAVKGEYHGSGYPKARGMTVWLPDRAKLNNYNREYSNLQFRADTKWLDFLTELWNVGFRIQLTWGADPEDLDSHLVNPAGERCYYANKVISDASLDLDDTTSFGPENITIDSLQGSGRYKYSVHFFSGDTSGQAATVRVFRGSNPVPVKTYTFSGWSAEGMFWNVFEIDAATGDIIDSGGSRPQTSRPQGLNLPAKKPRS